MAPARDWLVHREYLLSYRADLIRVHDRPGAADGGQRGSFLSLDISRGDGQHPPTQEAHDVEQ